jgi:hypothetical protein
MPRKRKQVLSDVLASGNTSKGVFKELGPASLQIDDLSNRLENQKAILKDSNFNVSSDSPRMDSELSDISKKQNKVKEDILNYNKSGALKRAVERNKFVKSKVREAENNEEIKSKLSEPKKPVAKEEPKQGAALVDATKKPETTETTKPNVKDNINWNEPYQRPEGDLRDEKYKEIERARADKAWKMQGIKYDGIGTGPGHHVFPDGTPAIWDPYEGRYLVDKYRAKTNVNKEPTAEENIQNGQKLVETISSDANNTVTDKVILEQIQNAESPEEIAKIKEDAKAAKIEEQKQKEQLANQNSAILDKIQKINEEKQGQRDSFDKVTTIEDVQRGVLDQYKNQASNVPYAVVEKLGIQDYYPNAGRDIAVGTFSGSRIGSQTIYSGAGALLPVGLYDARKRSLVEAAKNIQKKKDEFLQVPNAPQQFNADFQQAAYSQLYDIGAKHNWNMNAIMKDKEAMQRVYAIKNAAKDLAYTDEIVDNIFETLNTADGKTASYVPEDILQKMIEYRQGKLDVDAILSGENNVLELAGEIRNYANGTAWADKNLAEWKSDPVSLPLNLKTDKEITMDNLNEINQSIEKAKVSGSYDSYLTAVKKYFHLDPKVVDAWVEQNMVGATPEQKQKVVDDLNTYILAQMPPESIEEKIENLKNDNYNYWAKRQDLARYDKERETIMTRAINTANQAKLKDQISAINNDPKLNTPQKKRTALMNAYRKAGFTPTYNKETGQVYGSVAYSSTDPRVSNVTYNSDRAQVWVRTADQKDSKGRVIKKGKYEWAPVGKVLANKKSYSLNESELTELNQFAKGGAKGTVNETRMFETFVEGNNAVRVSENNINKYAKSQQKGIGTETFGNVIIVGQGEDGKPTYTPGKVKVKIQLNPETNPTDRNTLDAIYKKDVQNVSTDVGFDAQGPASNY